MNSLSWGECAVSTMRRRRRAILLRRRDGPGDPAHSDDGRREPTSRLIVWTYPRWGAHDSNGGMPAVTPANLELLSHKKPSGAGHSCLRFFILLCFLVLYRRRSPNVKRKKPINGGDGSVRPHTAYYSEAVPSLPAARYKNASSSTLLARRVLCACIGVRISPRAAEMAQRRRALEEKRH